MLLVCGADSSGKGLMSHLSLTKMLAFQVQTPSHSPDSYVKFIITQNNFFYGYVCNQQDVK